MYRAHLLDLWLFIRKVAPNGAAILLILLLSAAVFYGADAWPEASFLDCFINAVYMMTVESVQMPHQWWLEAFILVLPVLGVVFAAEGLVRAVVLFINKSLRQGEWNAVVASTFSGHTLVCGLGQFGGTISTGLLESGTHVVGVDLKEGLPTVVTARRRNMPVIIGDMTLPETLIEANVKKARCVVVCSGDDLANIETAIWASELNPDVVVYARVYKKTLADKINAALRYDIRTFSPDATAAETILAQMRQVE